MEVKLFNGWYFFFLALSIASVVGLYFLLRRRSEKTKKIVLFSILIFALALHFLKILFPPYQNNIELYVREVWFTNICGANLLLFPFIFFSKSKSAKDYMFYLGLLGGFIAVLYPTEVIEKASQATEQLDIIRFYIHHTILWGVPLLMVLFKLHTLSYRRVLLCPVWLLGIMLFIIVNQVLQSELGFTNLRGDDIFSIAYRNPSKIWGPGKDAIGKFLTFFCPEVFTKIPFGAHAGETKYWPWFWLIVPAFVILTPVAFLISLIFDWKNFKSDFVRLLVKLHLKKDTTLNEFRTRNLSEKESYDIIFRSLKDNL